MKKYLLLLLIPIQGFSICEAERDDYLQAQSAFETACAVSQGTGLVGGLLAVPTFGISMIPCGAACACAEALRQDRDHKKYFYDMCVSEYAERQGLRQELRVRWIKMQHDWFMKYLQIVTEFSQRDKQERINAYVAEQFDVEAPHVQEVIRDIIRASDDQLAYVTRMMIHAHDIAMDECAHAEHVYVLVKYMGWIKTRFNCLDQLYTPGVIETAPGVPENYRNLRSIQDPYWLGRQLAVINNYVLGAHSEAEANRLGNLFAGGKIVYAILFQ
jgi:hypothetical protein